MATTEAGQGGGRGGSRENGGKGGGKRAGSDRDRERVGMPEAMRAATGQLAELLRTEPGAVSALKSTESGWTADVEIVEIARIPDTTSVMASYRVELDPRGRITGYERTRRYSRGQVDR